MSELSGRFLVTGAAGFLGSFLCDRLISEGCSVVGVDNLITGRRENLRELLGHREFEFIEHDIVEPLTLDGGLSGAFHLASLASPVDYATYPVETLRVGANGTDNVLQLAEQKNCTVLVASTSEIYGDPLEHPQKESYWGNVNPIGLRGCYDESKRYMEALTMAFHRKRGVSTRIIRIFNTYGPRMRTDDGRVVPNFMMQALRGEALTLYGDGAQTRSFCYVDDLIEGILQVFLKGDPLPFNLGNPNELTIKEFAQRVCATVGGNAHVVYKDLPSDDPKVRRPDITRAKEVLGWSPQIDLQTGLEKTIEYFRSQLE